MKFNLVAETFARIETIDSRNEITKTLAALLQKATAHEASILMYLTLGMLKPPYESHQFAFAQKSMVKCLSELFGESVEKIQEAVDKLGDVGSLFDLYEWRSIAALQLEEVYAELCHFERITGTGSQEQKSAFFQDLLRRLDALSAKYVVRMVLGSMRLGFSDMTLLDALSWMQKGDKTLKSELEAAYNHCADLGLIARTLKDVGIAGIRNIPIVVGIPIRPAAAERLPNAQEIFEKLGLCVAQPKLDGFRLQVHYKKEQGHAVVKFFSRNLLDMSEMFPELVVAISRIQAESFVVEGEAIVFDNNTQSFLPFQDTVKRKRKHDIDKMSSDFPLRLYLFDILYYNGKSTLDISHEARRAVLQQLVGNDSSDSLFVIEEKKLESAVALEHYFLECLNAGLEGVVVKRPDAIYQPGKRNFNWIKLKYHADKKLEDTVDVVILGYYPGHGRRAQFQIGAFLVGVYNQESDSFETIAKVGTGLDDAQWVDLKKRCDEYAVKEQPNDVKCNKILHPKVWVRPHIVCEVLADEITISPAHTAGKTDEHLGMALRFPRFVKYRFDKNPDQTTSVSELAGMMRG